MTTVKIDKVKKEIETLSSGLSATDAQHIFYEIFGICYNCYQFCHFNEPYVETII